MSGSPVEVKLGAGQQGEHPVEMRLVARPEIGPERVLSEGERTCAALAGVLSEIDVTGNASGLVLDDPVTSLDHSYRKRIAERLATEAKKRQVIVFTHDIVFFFLLQKYGTELNVAITEYSLDRGYRGGHGRARPGPPWVAKLVNDRVGLLRNDLVEGRRLLKGGDRLAYERVASDVYKKLRMSWERAVEEVLLNNTVVRFGDSVQTKRLARLVDISPDDVELVTKEMSRCSDFEHDEAGAVYTPIPDPDIIEADLDRLAAWVKTLRKERGR